MTLDAATRPRPVLLTVSGVIPSDLDESIEIGRRPRSDYSEMAKAFDATLLDHPAATRQLGRVGALLERFVGPNLTLAMACFVNRRRHRVVFTDGEQVGLPFAALCWLTRRRPCHIMIGHRLSARKKVIVHRAPSAAATRSIVWSSTRRNSGASRSSSSVTRPQHVVLHPFMVDTAFWRPEQVAATTGPRPLICAVGQELRDYPTLVDAVRGLDADVVIAAASPWSKREDTSAGLDVPPNVTVRPCDHFELRQLYADAALVVVPLQETDFQAGITTILEAMSMNRAIVCTRTTGQTDTILDGETGRYVPIGDAAALRAAIEDLLADPAEAARLGGAGQRWVRAHADIEGVRRRPRLAGRSGRPGDAVGHISLKDSPSLPMYPRSGATRGGVRGGGRTVDARESWAILAVRLRRRRGIGRPVHPDRPSSRPRAGARGDHEPDRPRLRGRRAHPHVGHGAELVAGLDHHPADVLFSIANLRVLPDDVLARVRTAINFHDGPLPGYAGLNVTTLGHPQRRTRARHHVASDDGRCRRWRRRRDRAIPDRGRRDGVLAERALLRGGARDASRVVAAAVAAEQLEAQRAARWGASHFQTLRPTRAAARSHGAAVVSAREVRALDVGPRIANTVGSVRWVLGDEAYVVDRGTRPRRTPRGPNRARSLRSTATEFAWPPSTAISS